MGNCSGKQGQVIQNAYIQHQYEVDVAIWGREYIAKNHSIYKTQDLMQSTSL